MSGLFSTTRVLVCAAALGTSTAQAFAQSLPAPWTSTDVGGPTVAGGAVVSTGTFTVQGGGADIWNSRDEFHFVYQMVTGDVDLRAHVAAQDYVHRWTKSGVMIRESLDPGSPHASTFVTPARGLAFQRRITTGGVSTHTSGALEAAPHWVRIVRAGHQFTSYVSDDGAGWTLVGTETIVMAPTVHVGLAVTSHDPARAATATFTDVAVPVSVAAPPPAPAPAPPPVSLWTSADVGNPVLAGRASESGGTHSVTGGGADIWNGSDEFHFVYQPVAGDVEIVARVVNVEYAHRWSKAGVMIRETLTGPSAHAFMTASAARGWAFQRRPATAALSLSSPGSAGLPPGWVKLVRAGDVFSGYESVDGTSWMLVGTETIPMPDGVFVGLAVTSHNVAQTSTATFTDVVITRPASTTENSAPQVTLLAPASESTFTAPAEVILAAAASDADGSISQVEFFANGGLLGSDASDPYRFTWAGVAEGTYQVTAVATDDAGSSTTSQAATITVSAAPNESPLVTLTTPSAGDAFTAPAAITLAASASDADGTVARVEFYANGQPVGSAAASPYTVTWSNVAAGSYSLTAIARDDDGAATTSAPVTITVSAPPPPPPQPTRVAFSPSADHDTAVTSYGVSLYREGEPVTGTPVVTSDFGKPAPIDGEIVVDISGLVDPLPPGSYYAIVSATGSGGTASSAPSAAFAK